ncbi:nuclease-related domain-containing protein [Bacillus sp. REN16]|uniref:nuclease-related domain-containing protein n=1 Tax=Bacillus sp. REN16 TaxID=2887296 RepID=UPI001E6312FB|nr:NERD domain-containing protein [Bacillus sp. REN16]MCC3355602.1 NERD domain-containing protein [Bacillus sp. REN16]
MIIKERSEPSELVLLKILQARMKVLEKTVNQIVSLEKGFIGEKMFDQRMIKLTLDSLTINDLLLETNNTHYQIDSLLITKPKIHLFEVKNFEGDYLLDGDCIRFLSGKEIKNPLLQLYRSVSLFRQLLQQLRINYTVEGHLVYINPEFYLYNATPDLPIIFPSQLDRFVKQLNTQSSRLIENHHGLANKLLGLHIKDSPYSRLPGYSFENLEKGVICGRCGKGFMVSGDHHYLTCKKCNFVENKDAAVLRSVIEFSLLFPDKRITTNGIYEWCKVIKSKATIRKLLQENYKHVYYGNSSYFE